MRLLFLAGLVALLAVELKTSANPNHRFSEVKTAEERCSDAVWLVRTGDYDQGASELIVRRSCQVSD